MDGDFRSRMTIPLVRRAASIVLAAVALGGTTSAAQAADSPFGADQAQAAADVAKTYWSATPCAGQVTITWQPLAVTTNATSMWSNPVSAYGAPEQNSSCQILFNAALDWDWTRFCSVLVHEYGHLTGHDHSPDSGNVMYPYYTKPVAECQAAAPAQPSPATAAGTELVAAAAALPPAPVQAAQSHTKMKVAKLIVIREKHRLTGREMRAKHRQAFRKLRSHS